MEIYQVIREPHITEKAGLTNKAGEEIVFKVNPSANKIEIRQAVESLLKAKVEDVRTLNVKGKRRRVGKSTGKRPNWKKAYVRLAPGENVDYFDGIY